MKLETLLPPVQLFCLGKLLPTQITAEEVQCYTPLDIRCSIHIKENIHFKRTKHLYGSTQNKIIHCCNVLTLEAIERIVMCVQLHWQLNKLEWRSQRIKQLKAWNAFRRLSIWAIDGAFLSFQDLVETQFCLKAKSDTMKRGTNSINISTRKNSLQGFEFFIFLGS